MRSNSSRERILDTAETIILQKGFAGTSIEDILQQAALTKGGFFYHFKGKNELAKALVVRYLAEDEKIFSDLFRQADELSEDPLQRLLIFLKLFAAMMANLEQTHPGCLVAGFTYESQQFDEEVTELIRQGVDSWRNMIARRIDDIVGAYDGGEELDRLALADMFTGVIEGGIILSRVYGSNELLVRQILSYRDYLRRLFSPVPRGRAAP